MELNVKHGASVDIRNNSHVSGNVTLGAKVDLMNNCTIKGNVIVGAKVRLMNGCTIEGTDKNEPFIIPPGLRLWDGQTITGSGNANVAGFGYDQSTGVKVTHGGAVGESVVAGERVELVHGGHLKGNIIIGNDVDLIHQIELHGTDKNNPLVLTDNTSLVYFTKLQAAAPYRQGTMTTK